MRRNFFSLVLLTLAGACSAAANDRPVTPPSGERAATETELAMLNEVLHQTADAYPRWAYTEHRVMRDNKGRVKSDTLVRYDPSKPYAEQWTPLKIDGEEPSDRERAKYRRRGEKNARPASGMEAPNPDNRRRRSLGELIDVMKSSVAAETPTHLVFEVPLLKVGNERFPPEKFLVLARVNTHARQLENVSVRLREAFRSKFVVKVKSGEGSLDFATVDPKHPPALVAIEGDAVADHGVGLARSVAEVPTNQRAGRRDVPSEPADDLCLIAGRHHRGTFARPDRAYHRGERVANPVGAGVVCVRTGATEPRERNTDEITMARLQ